MVKPAGSSVSVIIPTFNNEGTLAQCLDSVLHQSRKADQIVVIDGGSSDCTVAIAKAYGVDVLVFGRERSEQANRGVEASGSEYILRLDADFVLCRTVIAECMKLAEEGAEAVEIHNEPDASVSWIARARHFEYALLKGDLLRTSARFVRRDAYVRIGGLNPRLVAGEDFDFQNRLIAAGYKVVLADASIVHLGEPRRLVEVIRKFFSYGVQAVVFRAEAVRRSGQLDARGVLQKLYLSKWREYRRSPYEAFLFLVYYSIKVAAGAAGFCWGKVRYFGQSGLDARVVR